MINKDSIIKLKGKMKWREEDGWYTLYNFDDDELYEVSNYAIDIIELSDGEKTIQEIIGEILKKYQISEEHFEEFFDFVVLLISKNILKVCREQDDV